MIKQRILLCLVLGVIATPSNAQDIEIIPLDAPEIVQDDSVNTNAPATNTEKSIVFEDVIIAPSNNNSNDAAKAAEMIKYPVVRLRALDKITARTVSFDVNVGETVKFGDVYIRPQTCQEPPPIEEPESSAFLQIWERPKPEESKWIFSGWMFASSPGLSAMDHPVYDVWVLDCREKAEEVAAPAPEAEEVTSDDVIDEDGEETDTAE
ncbi:MAG: DUF2155 domain-containing protein [Pseudomonadota bacterium]|nr:DUF2155 domain-containing protein [Alphaproteobacteria bacterium]MEC7577487.1 DUF2155 domain-containing protein [Pseudomonadota bacterium]MEC7703149.1 DUF2155 domain-containing protein [Pseudomonadota bacterium]MEC9236897.1 DUF2155 domain-containing protein [Pseudomonadota bacterium]MED5422622.1 DUF2155 domain-containing protein [Pseudomonadota bacterium]